MEMAEEALKVLNSSLFHIKWHLKSPSKRRLETDILALCSGMRPVVMIDYGGKMPELQDHLCALLKSCQQASAVFENLRVMVIDDMIYLIHIKGLADYATSSMNLEVEMLFVDLEQDPPKMVTQGEKCSLTIELVKLQKLFSLLFLQDGLNCDPLPGQLTDMEAKSEISTNKPTTSQSSLLIDLSGCMEETQVTVPTLNGWLLGYPVVYLFGKQCIKDAIFNLSTKSLHIFRILVSRNVPTIKESQQEELMSFSVPYDLSLLESKEPWAKAFLAQLQLKWENCKLIWSSLQLEVSACYPQAIVL
ncbi:hypothetical protein K2173_019192 [Erythroxylum novogranatense]|uniref:Uncharacterized protein n=1 Tax=Erythroxylum novogranatense TaxID=1862640 RepID=A0AAV8STW9_9ROSI|nr:hypothetical protein K2173_019192 [Erythroxylum novogranatense]